MPSDARSRCREAARRFREANNKWLALGITPAEMLRRQPTPDEERILRERVRASNALNEAAMALTTDEKCLGLLRFLRLPDESMDRMSDDELDAYFDAPATEEEKREVKRMLAREGEWSDVAPSEDSETEKS